MKFLVDTHALLWYAFDDPQLSGTAKGLIQDSSNKVVVSAACFWEIAIKMSIGKLKLRGTHDQFVCQCLGEDGFSLLPIEPAHTSRVATLPFPSDHRDPFNRLLVAQALV